MRFWDSSAVVPLLVEQDGSSRAAAWAAADDGLVVWTLTPVEVVSALRRLARVGTLDESAARQAETRLDELVRACHVVIDVEPVKALATRLLRLHPLRAFDALQLGAALHWATLKGGRCIRLTSGWPGLQHKRASSFRPDRVAIRPDPGQRGHQGPFPGGGLLRLQ